MVVKKKKTKEKKYAATLYVPKKKTAKKKVTKPKEVIIDEREQSRTQSFSHDDIILSGLTLPNPCTVTIVINRDTVSLGVGPRDWQWDRGTGELIGSGTELVGSVEIPAADTQPVEGVLESDTEVFDETDKMLGIGKDSDDVLTDPNSVDEEKAG